MFSKEQFLKLDINRQIDFAMIKYQYFQYLDQENKECEKVLEYYYENNNIIFNEIVEYIHNNSLRYLVLRLKGKQFLKNKFDRNEAEINIPDHWFNEDDLLKLYYFDNNLPLKDIIKFFKNEEEFSYVWKSFIEGKQTRNYNDIDNLFKAENLPIKIKIDIFKFFEKEVGIVYKQRLGRSSRLNISINVFFENIQNISKEELDLYFSYGNKINDEHDITTYFEVLLKILFNKKENEVKILNQYFIDFIKTQKHKDSLIYEYLYYVEHNVQLKNYDLYENMIKKLYLIASSETKKIICQKFVVDNATLVLGEL